MMSDEMMEFIDDVEPNNIDDVLTSRLVTARFFYLF